MKPGQFKKIRKELGFSQAEMAKFLGLKSSRAIRHYEAGTRRISGPIILLLKVLGQKVIKR